VLTDLSAIAVRDADLASSIPRPVFVFMAPADQGEAFLDAHVVPAARGTVRGIADPDQVLHRAFEVPRGGWREMFGPRSWIAGARVTLRGKFIGAKVGNGWTLPVWTVVDGDQVLWRWVGSHAGDRPDLTDIPRTTRRST
jgi:hypothetical protein